MLDVDRQPNTTPHRQRRKGGGATFSRPRRDSLGGCPEDSAVSSCDGRSGTHYRAGPDVDVKPSVCADADYAKEDAARRSGGAVLCGGSPVAWFSRTQKSVTLSTTEAEYVAMGDGVKEALFVHGMLEFLSPGKKLKGIRMLEDNGGAIALAENPISSSNSEHIDVRHHFLRDLVCLLYTSPSPRDS